jgi:hypothetical protein
MNVKGHPPVSPGAMLVKVCCGEMEGNTVTRAPVIVSDIVLGTELYGEIDGICVMSIVGLHVISVHAATIVV